ncbi:hypothetical protein N8555_01140 [bacterium]|nr:hypothetical protein [bacterium]
MRTITASKIIAGAVELTGRLFTKLNNDELQVVIRSLGRNLHQIWETEFWPALMAVEKRYFRPSWAAGTYASNTEIYHSGTDKYYKNTSGGNTSSTPGSHADWAEITDFTPSIEFQQTGATEIGQVFRVTAKDPRENLNQGSVSFSLKDDSILIDYKNENFYWIEFRKQCPLIDARKWSSGSCSKGDEFYYYDSPSASGNFYASIADSNNTTPGSNTTHWEKIDIPFFVGPYLEHAIASDILLVDEKIELAGIQMRARDRALEQEMQRVKNQSGDAFSPRFKTY